MKLIRACLLCLVLTLCAAARGETITFDDLPATGFSATTPSAPPNGYQGLNWYEMFLYNTSAFPAGGFVNGTISPNNVVVIPDFKQPPIGPQTVFPPATISAASTFFLESGYFTATAENGVQLEVIGLNGTTTEFDQTFTVNANSPSFLTFPDLPVTEVDFTSSGGDPASNPTYFSQGNSVVVDNLTIDFVSVPDAAPTALLLAASVGGLAVLRKRFS